MIHISTLAQDSPLHKAQARAAFAQPPPALTTVPQANEHHAPELLELTVGVLLKFHGLYVPSSPGTACPCTICVRDLSRLRGRYPSRPICPCSPRSSLSNWRPDHRRLHKTGLKSRCQLLNPQISSLRSQWAPTYHIAVYTKICRTVSIDHIYIHSIPFFHSN